MPSIELKPAQNRKRGRSRLHLSSTAQSPTSPVSPTDSKNGTLTALKPTTINTTTTPTPASSSSDERHEKSPSASSISSSSFFDDEHWRRVIRKREQNGLRDTVQWGYFLLLTTWVVFVLGIGGVCGVWDWSLKSIRTDTKNRIIIKGDEALSMSGYYPALTVLTGAVVAWVWVVFNWVGMKYFRHN